MTDLKTLLGIVPAVLALVAIAPGCSSAPGSDETTTSAADDDLRKKDPCTPCGDSCSRCTDQPGCGWDHIHDKCRSGNVYGPSSRKPSDASLDWISGTWTTTEDTCKLPASDPDPHAACAAKDCRECAEQPDCGWYMPNGKPGRCVAGTSSAPFDYEEPFDSGLNWIYQPLQCLMGDDTIALPAGPTCHGTAADTAGGGSGGTSSGGDSTSEDYVCTVTTTNGSGQTQVTYDYGCAKASDEQSTTYTQQCVNGYLGQSSASCEVSDCHPTGVPYVCPCGPSDPRSYCH